MIGVWLFTRANLALERAIFSKIYTMSFTYHDLSEYGLLLRLLLRLTR